MNKKLIDEVSKEMEKAVQEVAKRLNVNIEFDGGSYNLTEGKLKFKVTEVGEKLENSMKDEYNRYCPIFTCWIGIANFIFRHFLFCKFSYNEITIIIIIS